ncbi:hypothetical protein C2S52_005441 [Perilla frutescens var. hirtella]|uniref:Uncharacterized protein n=1 Tax=Perilla frutescens var. hirtella TaxID=608512 RepID=A0AAD4J8N7_PERFH|nr:hypothetical protein C2S51_010238 [Perilla frutescens var. frutescens]KAH6794964.1 hypothetical protein C2S52_005441 [Perilla frutescens var. hirtella]KAH6829243.1 hypothetical protein C2S53_007941 [Perilla frutescens var. hirtella]
MASSSSTSITTLLFNNKNTHNYKYFNDDGQCSFLRQNNFQRFSSTRPSNKDRVVRRATPEVAGDLLSSFSLPAIPGFEDNPWLVGICGLLVGVPVMIQRLVALSKQLDAAAQTVEKISDTVERVADEVDKAAEELKEALPEGRFKQVVSFVEHFAEETSEKADMVGDLMDKVEEIDDKLEEFLDKGKGKAADQKA